jgi:glycosyltransferase involved in cell wall biosynthesis
MNILFVDQFSEPGGAQLALRDVIDAAGQRGWTPFMLAPGEGLPLRPLTSGRKGARDLVRFISDLPRMREALRRAIAQYSADLVYINGPRVLPAATGIDIPVIFHAHSYVNGSGPRWLAMHSVRHTGAVVIAASRFIARSFQAASRLKIRVIYNGSPDYGATFSKFGTETQTRIRIGMVGRLAPEKGQLDFVRAARLIGTGSARFTIYGDSLFSGDDYASQVRVEAPAASVELQGWRKDVGAVYRELDVLVVPSFAREASTRVIMEAFSAGVPVVAYPSGGIPEIVDHGRTGLLTAEPNFESLAASLRRLIANRTEMNTLALAGRAEWKARFTKERFQSSVCEVIESAMRSDPVSAAPKGSGYPGDRNRKGGGAPRETATGHARAERSGAGVSCVQPVD